MSEDKKNKFLIKLQKNLMDKAVEKAKQSFQVFTEEVGGKADEDESELIDFEEEEIAVDSREFQGEQFAGFSVEVLDSNFSLLEAREFAKELLKACDYYQKAENELIKGN